MDFRDLRGPTGESSHCIDVQGGQNGTILYAQPHQTSTNFQIFFTVRITRKFIIS